MMARPRKKRETAGTGRNSDSPGISPARKRAGVKPRAETGRAVASLKVQDVPADFLAPIAGEPRVTIAAVEPEPQRPSNPAEATSDIQAEAGVSHVSGAKHEDHARRRLVVEYYDQEISLIESEVAFVGHYLGVSQIGPAEEINRKLVAYSQLTMPRQKCRTRRKKLCHVGDEEGRASDLISLEKFIELGIVVGSLGALNLFPLPEAMAGIDDPRIRVLPRNVLLGGFGEPGHMNRENVRFVFTNVVYAMKALSLHVLSTALIGTLRKVLNTQQSLRSILEGIEEGMRRFDVDDIVLRLSYEGEAQGRTIQKTLKSLHDSRAFADRLDFEPAERPAPVSQPRVTTRVVRADDEEDFGVGGGAHITITSANVDEFQFAEKSSPGSWPATEPDHEMKKRVLKFSALSSTSIIPVRRVAVQEYFADMLPKRVLSHGRLKDQWQYGYLMMRCFVPEDFQCIVEDGDKLTLVLDRETARIPWEMAGFKLRSDERFFGTDLEISRQFRSVLGETNGHFPELNHILRILIIADPASRPEDGLDFAKLEGIDVARVVADARQAYGDYEESLEDSHGRMDIKIYLRIGNTLRDGPIGDDPRLAELIADCGEDIDIDRCDPVEILKLLMTEDFDAVHYAGHGIFDPDSGEMGWLIDSDCFLTAEEIFRIRRVPRLVFANACHSGQIQQNLSIEDAVARQVGMAEAFFSRGIENYVGTAWAVDDDVARRIAVSFYRHALGVHRETIFDAPVTTEIRSIGAALTQARKEVVIDENRREKARVGQAYGSVVEEDISRGITWGAYQHYGVNGARLIAPLKHTQGG